MQEKTLTINSAQNTQNLKFGPYDPVSTYSNIEVNQIEEED